VDFLRGKGKKGKENKEEEAGEAKSFVSAEERVERLD